MSAVQAATGIAEEAELERAMYAIEAAYGKAEEALEEAEQDEPKRERTYKKAELPKLNRFTRHQYRAFVARLQTRERYKERSARRNPTGAHKRTMGICKACGLLSLGNSRNRCQCPPSKTQQAGMEFLTVSMQRDLWEK